MLSQKLLKRAQSNNPIRVGIVGAGKFGSGLAVQISRMKGMKVCAIADFISDRARAAYTASGFPKSAVRSVRNKQELDDAIHSGNQSITEDGLLLATSDLLEVLVECTGIPEVGARIAYMAITHNTHVVMVNVEADVTVGPILKHQADRAGLVYTLVDGDQPGVIMNLVEWARCLGFELVAAGRGTIFYKSDREGTPDTVPNRFGFTQETIQQRKINIKMFNSFRDGSKAQIEMTALANMTGLVPDVRGMHEPSLNLPDIVRELCLKEEGGILGQQGVVELANSVQDDGITLLDSPLGMGVFVIIRTDHPIIQEDLGSYYLHSGGNGQNFLIYRPYHLVAVEAPLSIAHAVLNGQQTGAPLHIPTAETIAVAKRDLKRGEILDGSGGYTVNGLIEKAKIATSKNFLPLGLASGVPLTEEVTKGTAITYDMVNLDENSFALTLRRLQDATIWNNYANLL